MRRTLVCILVGMVVVSQAALVCAQPRGTPLVGPPPLLRPGKLIIAINATIPPVQYIDEKGNLRGMRVELGDEITRRLNLEANWVNIQFEAMIPGLQGSRWDMINTGLFYTEERAKIMSLVPYELQAISVSVPKGNPHKVKSTEDMAGKVVAVEVAGYEERNIKAINQEQVAKGLKPLPAFLRRIRNHSHDPIFVAAKKMGVKPHECLMIGDTTVDIRAGKSAGAQTVGVLCGFGEEKELLDMGADLILSNTHQLVDVLNGERPKS